MNINFIHPLTLRLTSRQENGKFYKYTLLKTGWGVGLGNAGNLGVANGGHWELVRGKNITNSYQLKLK